MWRAAEVVGPQKKAARRAVWTALWSAPVTLVGVLAVLFALWIGLTSGGIVGALLWGGIASVLPFAIGPRFVRALAGLRDLFGALRIPVDEPGERLWPGATLKVTLPPRRRRLWRWSLVHVERAAWYGPKNARGHRALEPAEAVEVRAHGSCAGGALEVKIPADGPSTLLPADDGALTFRRIDWELRLRGRGATRRVPILVVPGKPEHRRESRQDEPRRQ